MYYNPLGLNLNAGHRTNVFGNPPMHPMVRMGMSSASRSNASGEKPSVASGEPAVTQPNAARDADDSGKPVSA